MDVVVEAGAKKAFASALDWPGLCRSGRTPDDACANLTAYVPRYKKAIGSLARTLKATDKPVVVERQKGNSTTDWGAPDMIARDDGDAMDAKELERHVKILQACWRAFDAAATKAKGRKLATGPRGGGRDVVKMRAHVIEADAAYLGPLGGDTKAKDPRAAFVDALRKRNAGELPDKGPRGGKRWPARYAIRRSAWHALDHTWELEDRMAR